MDSQEVREAMERVYQARASLVSGRTKVRRPTDVLPIIDEYCDAEQEYFVVVLLNGANQVIEANVVTLGIANRTVIHPREVFREAIRKNAVSIILAHNHPSGSLEPSPEDHEMFRRIQQASQIIGIPVLDSIIVAKSGYYSYLEQGQM